MQALAAHGQQRRGDEMFRSGIAYTDLTVNSACDELFPGVEDVDAQATLQLRAALDAFDEGVFEFHNRAAKAAGGAHAEAGSKAHGGRGQRRTRREMAYASRIPEDRQFFRPVEVQSAEWAAFKPHLWLRGRQVAHPEAAPHVHSHPHLHTPPPPPATGPAVGAAAGAAAAAKGSSSSPPPATATAASPQAAGELCVHGIQMRLAPPPPGLDVGQEEVLAAEGTYEETFVVQYDEWEAHVPAHLRRRRGRPRDEKAVAIGLPPVEPKHAVLYDIAETLLPELWSRLAPLLAPLLARLAEERRQQSAAGGVRASTAFRGGGTAGGRGGGRPGGIGIGGGGEFEIITFSSGEDEAASGEILVGGSHMMGLGPGMGVDEDEEDMEWPGGRGGDAGDDYDSFTGAAARNNRVPGSFHSGAFGDRDSILECESYDSDGELYQVGGGGGHVPSPPYSPMGATKLVTAAADSPASAAQAAAATVTAPTAETGVRAAGGGRTPPPGPPPVLPRDLLPPDSALGAPLGRGAPALRRPSVLPVAPLSLSLGASQISPRTSPSQSNAHSRSHSISQAHLRFSTSGEAAAAAGAAGAAPPPLAPLAPLHVPLGSPRGPSSQSSPGAQPLCLVPQQLLGGGHQAAGPPHPQQHPYPNPHAPAAGPPQPQPPPLGLQPSAEALALMGLAPFRIPPSAAAGVSSSNLLTLQPHHQAYLAPPQGLQAQQQQHQQPQQQHQQQPTVGGAHQPVPRRVPSLSLVSVPPPYTGGGASAGPSSHISGASGALEVSGMVVPGAGGSGARGPTTYLAAASAAAVVATAVVGGGGGGKQQRLGGGGGSFGSSSGALPSPVAALSQHSRFLAVPAVASPTGATQTAGAGGGGGASPTRLRNAGVVGGPMGSIGSPAGPAGGGAGVAAAIPTAAAAAAAATANTVGGVAGPSTRSRLPNPNAAGPTGAGGHHSVHLMPLRGPSGAAAAAVGGATGAQVGPAGASAIAMVSTATPVLNRMTSGELTGGRSASSLSGFMELQPSSQQSQSGQQSQQHPPRRSNGSRTSPLRKGSQGSPAAAAAGSQQPQLGAAASVAGGGGGGAAANAGSGASRRLPALSLSPSLSRGALNVGSTSSQGAAGGT